MASTTSHGMFVPFLLSYEDFSLTRALITALSLYVLIYFATAVYAITLHPLARYPGPKLAAISRIPWWYQAIRGDQISWMLHLHEEYGSVVRFSPNDLSYVDHGGEAWKAVHSHTKGTVEFPKAKEWFVDTASGIRGMNNYLEPDQHRRLRRIFAPAFSDRALKSQEPLFQRHVDMLISKLAEATEGDKPVNMLDMFQFTTFDIMGDLTFGQPLGLLENGRYSDWVQHVFDAVKVIPVAQVIQYYPILNFLFKHLEPKFVTDMKFNHFRHSADRVDLRLKNGSEKPDIWNLVLSTDEKDRLALEEMYVNSEVFMLSGSETTGTALSGLLYLLLRNPDKMRLLVDEIRGRFSSNDEITFESTAPLRYLHACIQEGMRLYPPVPAGVPRAVHKQGQNILGTWVPGGTRASVHHWSTYRSPRNFRDPNAFAPERWMAGRNDTYASDSRESFQPFGYGSRACVGQNMTLFEMRVIVCKVLLGLDFALADPRDVWTEQKAFVLWEKKPLMCRVAKAGGS